MDPGRLFMFIWPLLQTPLGAI